MNLKLLTHLSTAICDASHRPFTLRTSTPVGGGSINEAYRLEGMDGSRYFLKLNDAQHYPMFVAEAAGLAAIAATNTISVPRTIAHGSTGDQSFLVLEYLELGSHGDAQLLGERLAALHRFSSDGANGNSQAAEEVNSGHSRPGCSATPCHDRTSNNFGYAQDNFIGTTPQPNTWTNNWVTFWREQRLGFQLRLAAQNGYGGQLQRLGEKLLDVLPAFLAGYTPQPSLLHGDLWSGNQAYLADGTPAIFDPAVYYGDRECDLAMTELFGGYPADFYAAYRAAYPLDDGYATRRDLYNLYHILNHANLFAGGYARQAEQMMQRLLSMAG
ncbi:MAG: Fructosamine/Ketosamine-3-kinase [Candidatus Gallionella acididurans]|uniref:Fructosamine/Ketosamine-3-kinase n=1 Tax=Candidatus Gallionella acididurans TaxID=1796491 RepID=A0A139BS05_9PROT|nr:MAG: Fructosamine/Ketosamine-3-kinase [Candidatus Gallionella acididurans]